MVKFTSSSVKHPCPICGRTKDGDCRSLEAENLVLCHTYQETSDPIGGYEFVRRSEKGAGWGVWMSEKPKKAERPIAIKSQEFIYTDRQGQPLVKVTRKGRDFWQASWNGHLWANGLTAEARKAVPIYRYTEVQTAISQSKTIFFVEGESCADTLWRLGIPATTSLGGSKGYRTYGDYKADLADADLVLCPDRDVQGMAYIETVKEDFPNARLCRVYPKSPIWQRLPESNGLDVVDWVLEGATKADILESIESPVETKSSTKEAPKFHETLDQVDLLERAIDDDTQLAWEVQNFAFENQLTSRGFSGSRLLQFARARRDGEAAIEVIDAHDILKEYHKPDFLISGNLLKGSVVAIAANGGSGKTSLCYDFAKHIATGEPWSGYRVDQGRSLIVQTDEPKPNIAQKLRIAKFGTIPRGSARFITKWRFTQFRQLERLVKDESYSFVVIDSWTAAHAGMGIDLTKSSAGDNAYLLRNLAEDTGAVIVVIHHLNKLGEFRDSTTLRDNVSEAWRMTEGKREDGILPHQRVLHIEKSRADLKGTYLLEQNAIDYSWKHLGLLQSPDNPDELPLIVQIQSELEGNPGKRYSPKDVAIIFGCSTDKADLELQRLYRHGVLECEWISHQYSNGDRAGYFGYFFGLDNAIAIPSSPGRAIEFSATSSHLEEEF